VFEHALVEDFLDAVDLGVGVFEGVVAVEVDLPPELIPAITRPLFAPRSTPIRTFARLS